MAEYVLGFVYQLGDFDTTGSNITPPDEQGARAQGTPPFNITLLPGVVPLRIVIEDDDANFNETTGSDPLQELVDPVTIDGVTYPAGSHVVINYVLTDDNGFEGFSITIGETNSGNNTTTAFISNQPMVPGQTYVFTSEGNIGGAGARPYAEFACFTTGTLIDTPFGPRSIEGLSIGDQVSTVFDGTQRIRWIGRKSVPGIGLMTPVTITAGHFGCTSDLTVSPNHRILIEGAIAELVTGCDKVLVAAKHLVNGTTVTQHPRGLVTYVHLMFDKHEIVTTQGCQSESFFLGACSSQLLDQDHLEEMRHLFPDFDGVIPRELVLPEAKHHEATLIGKALAA